MGFYLNENSKGEKLGDFDKVLSLVADGATIISEKEAQVGDVAVAEDILWDAAVYAASEDLLNYYKEPTGRPTTWLRYPAAKAIINKEYGTNF